jgi:prepilin-type N-terminal cleavage/methylation domain-containing protein
MKMRKGFTLIELLIVLAIIATLLSVTTPVALNAVKKAKATQVAANLRNIRSAVESYFYVEGATTTLDTLIANGYLSSTPTNFILDSTDNNDGSHVFEIVYKGADVDKETLQKVYPAVKATDTDYYVRFTVRSW